MEGWRGDNFAFTFNIADYNVVTSDSVHLPPTVHLFMQATGVYVMNFLPKPAESVPGTERTPWYHRNVDYDEIAFFHGGSLYGIPMPPGLISHAPQGVHHGAPEKARERARRKFDEYDRVDWSVIAIDTRRRLVPSAEVLANDLGAALMPTTMKQPVKYEYDRIPYLVAYQNNSACARHLRRRRRTGRAGELSAQAEDQSRQIPCWCSCTPSAAARICR